MLRKEQNDLLTQTGPATPGGAFFRSYWLPALLAEELPEQEGPPVRWKLLSERLLAWRDSQGRLSLMDEFCAHRGVSLWFGRNEENGLRCPYHGWKYDHTGQCIDVPSEPEESGYCKRVKLKSYPLVEKGGILWTYMGPPETQPPLPDYEFIGVKRGGPFVARRRGDSIRTPVTPRGVCEVAKSPGGFYTGPRRNAENNQYYWRITPWVMPCFTMIAPRGNHPVHGHFWVPIDDENCWAWSFDFHPLRALTETEVQAMQDGKGIYVKFVPGSYRPLANKDNDYLIDRAAQKAGRYFSGVEGIAMQDASLQESMGPIVDRTKENLVSTDNGIIMARHRSLRAVKVLIERDITPPGVEVAHQRVRSAAVLLPPDRAYNDAAREALTVREGVAPASV